MNTTCTFCGGKAGTTQKRFITHFGTLKCFTARFQTVLDKLEANVCEEKGAKLAFLTLCLTDAKFMHHKFGIHAAKIDRIQNDLDEYLASINL